MKTERQSGCVPMRRRSKCDMCGRSREDEELLGALCDRCEQITFDVQMECIGGAL